MEVQTDYKFDGETTAGEIASFLKEQHRIEKGTRGDNAAVEKIQAFSTGNLGMRFTLDHDPEA